MAIFKMFEIQKKIKSSDLTLRQPKTAAPPHKKLPFYQEEPDSQNYS